MASEEDYVDTVEALLSTVIRPCLGEGSRGARYPPVSRGEAQQMFGGLRGEEILNRNTELRNDVSYIVSNSDAIVTTVATIDSSSMAVVVLLCSTQFVQQVVSMMPLLSTGATATTRALNCYYH
jgi:hypothetical protein